MSEFNSTRNESSGAPSVLDSLIIFSIFFVSSSSLLNVPTSDIGERAFVAHTHILGWWRSSISSSPFPLHPSFHFSHLHQKRLNFLYQSSGIDHTMSLQHSASITFLLMFPVITHLLSQISTFPYSYTTVMPKRLVSHLILLSIIAFREKTFTV